MLNLIVKQNFQRLENAIPINFQFYFIIKNKDGGVLTRARNPSVDEAKSIQ